MKRITCLAVCVLLLCSATVLARPEAPNLDNVENMTPEQIAATMAQIEGRLIASHDEFSKMTFLDHYLSRPQGSWTGMRFCPFIGYGPGHKGMFVAAYYTGKDWVFMDRVSVLVGAEVYETPRLPSYHENVIRKVTSYGVFESLGFPWSDPAVERLGRAIANAPLGTVIKVRFDGVTNYDFTLMPEEHQAWKEVIFYYDHLQP